MIDFNYVNSLPELPASPVAGNSYRVTRDWGTSLFNPAGKKLTLYILHSGVLNLSSGAVFGAQSSLFVMGSVKVSDKVTFETDSRIVMGDNGMFRVYAETKADEATKAAVVFAKQCAFEAPVKQVFDKNVTASGIWDIPTAYPQWFTDMVPKRQSVEWPTVDFVKSGQDWSKPIQDAVNMKITGEVFLMRGVYTVENPINMKPGIQLRGECGVNWNNLVSMKDDPNDSKKKIEDWTRCQGSTVIEFNVPGSNNAPYKDFLLRINANVTDGKPSVASSDLFQSGTMVENIFFKAATWAHQRCIVAACPCHFNNLGFRNFRQAILFISASYYDGRRITNCNAGDYFSEKVASTDDDDYMFNLFANGDACIVEGLAVGSKQYKALKIGNSCGSVIQGCIFNAPVHIRHCKGTIFAANHMESSIEFNVKADTRLVISNSDITVEENYFEKSSRSSVEIRDGQWGDTSVVNLLGNQFVYITGVETNNENPNRPLTKTEIDNKITRYQVTEQALQNLSSRINNICEYDIQIDPYCVVNLSNNFRYGATSNSGVTSSFPFGIMLSKTSAVNANPMLETVGTPLTEFNDKSYCFSQQSSITAGKIVTTPYFLGETGDSLSYLQTNSASINGAGTERLFWLIGSEYYKSSSGEVKKIYQKIDYS